MTLLPEVKQALVEGAAGYHSRRRRAARMAVRGAVVVAATALIAVPAAALIAGGDEPEREVAQQSATGPWCTWSHPATRAGQHEDRVFTAADYATNPPAGGDHAPTPAEDGIYPPGSTPPLGELVHALEHGRINLQYRPGTPADQVRQLEAVAAEDDGYHVLLFENTTEMQAAVAATAWGHVITCEEFSEAALQQLRTFRERYTDKGPEQVP